MAAMMDLKMSRASTFQKILVWGGVLVFTGIFFMIIFSRNGIIDLYHLNKEKTAVMEEIQRIESKNQLLSRQVNRLKHDLDYIEHVAKHELCMAASNDLVFKIMKNTGRE